MSGVVGTLSAQNSIIGNGFGFGTYIGDGSPIGTFVASGLFGGPNPPVSVGVSALQPGIIGSGSLASAQLFLNTFGLPGQTVTITPTFIQQVLAESGTLVLGATQAIIINSPFLPTQRGSLILDTPRLLATTVHDMAELQFQPNTTLNGVALPEQVIPQMLDMVGATEPQEGVLNVAYKGPTAPLCVTVRPDGGCQVEPTGSLSDTVSSRGNAYLGDLRLGAPAPRYRDFSVPQTFRDLRFAPPPPPAPAP